MYPLVRACPLCYAMPRLLRQLMARNVCPWEYLCYRHCARFPQLSLQDIQQAGKVHSVKDTVPYRKAHLLKISPSQYEETPWRVVEPGRQEGQGGRKQGERK